MAQSVKDNKILLFDEDIKDPLLEGAKASYEAVTTTYGPKGLNVLIEKPYGRPVLTRDGVTVAKEVYFSHRPKNMGTQMMLEASQTTNRLAGDGTTQTVALAYHLLKQGRAMIASGVNPMEVRDIINRDAEILLDHLQAYVRELTDGQLEQVATVSCGDPALGKLIAEAVEHVGLDGGIIAEKAYTSGVEREYVNGYYFEQGFSALSEGKKELDSPIVVVTGKKVSSNADFLELINKIVTISKETPPRVAFVGEIEGMARESIIANVMQGKMDAVIINTPSSGEMGTAYLEDIAIYCGCKMLAAGDSIKNIDSTYLGRAEKVVCTPYSSSIFGGQHSGEDVEARVAEIKERIAAEESDSLTEKFRDRIAKLQGKIAVFKIGGATDTEKEEKEFRIEDAIQSSRAALSEGVVAGGGTTLLHLSQAEGLSKLFKEALRDTFKRLIENANLPADVKLMEVLNSKYPMGINLRGTDEVVDLIKAGVLDPALVLKEVIKNAASNAGNTLTIGCGIVAEDKEDKKAER